MRIKLIIALLFIAAVVPVLVLHRFYECPAALTIERREARRTPSQLEEATDTCVSDRGSQRIVVLRVSNGSLSFGSEPIGEAQLPRRLQEIYATRAERLLYVRPDKDASFRRVVDIANVVRDLNIQIRLVTAQAMNAPCPKGYFNWATQGFPAIP